MDGVWKCMGLTAEKLFNDTPEYVPMRTGEA